VEGGILPPGFGARIFEDSQRNGRAWLLHAFLCRAGRTGSTAGEDARRYGRREKIHFNSAHFRRDIAAKAV